jgi:hypothetical protein
VVGREGVARGCEKNRRLDRRMCACLRGGAGDVRRRLIYGVSVAEIRLLQLSFVV